MSYQTVSRYKDFDQNYVHCIIFNSNQTGHYIKLFSTTYIALNELSSPLAILVTVFPCQLIYWHKVGHKGNSKNQIRAFYGRRQMPHWYFIFSLRLLY